ncbi:hypothetical protein PFISCL1PPCAC_5195 [Pristionchus fissidentatus]|uniref:SEFIR domain-containing protein n=1 Tax=Pristionchus fissidentatus TaxID=1538716 RepID=A0AAV5V6D4_9BILA|nr:hypothetical protein PFISCL1PPCAC_5195 [Pristionchus fissidentatus]
MTSRLSGRPPGPLRIRHYSPITELPSLQFSYPLSLPSLSQPLLPRSSSTSSSSSPQQSSRRSQLILLPTVIPSLPLCLIAIACLLPYSLAAPPCAPRVHFGAQRAGATTPSPHPLVYEDSKSCVDEILKRGGEENSTLTPWNPCKAAAMDIKVGSHIVLPSGNDNFVPFARLNISVTVFDRAVADTVFLRLECLEAAVGEDTYCNSLPPEHIAKYGRTIWPCRGASVGSEDTSPFTLSFDCFHLFPASRYYVNVTAFPSGCSSTLSVTIPDLREAYPQLSKFYKQDKETSWSPMLLVDMSASEDGVWLRASIPPGAEWRVVELRLYKVNDGAGASLIPLKEFQLKNEGNGSEIGVKWVDADRGRYVLMGFVPRHDCALHCESSSPSCRPCAHTRLPFLLTRDYWTESTAMLRRTRDVGVWVLPVCLGLLVACTIIIGLYVRHVRKAAGERTRDILLPDRPPILLLYSDDCEQHSKVVREIAAVLDSCAHVAFDQEDLLTNGSLIPYDWLARSLAAAKKIVVILSPSTPILMQREQQLKSRRPYPDMLQPALKEISKDLCKPVSRVAFVRLSYSPQLPDEFSMLGGRCFSLPSDLPRLVSFLHGVATEEAKDITLADHDAASLIPLKEAIDEMEKWLKEVGEGWIEERMEPIDTRTVSVFDTERIEFRRAGMPMPIENRMVEGLLPPDEEEMDGGVVDIGGEAGMFNRIPAARAAPKEHVLLPPDPDSDDD